MNTCPKRLRHEDLAPARRVEQPRPAPGRGLGVVERAQHPRLRLDEGDHLALVEGVVAQRQAIGPRAQQLRRMGPVSPMPPRRSRRSPPRSRGRARAAAAAARRSPPSARNRPITSPREEELHVPPALAAIRRAASRPASVATASEPRVHGPVRHGLDLLPGVGEASALTWTPRAQRLSVGSRTRHRSRAASPPRRTPARGVSSASGSTQSPRRGMGLPRALPGQARRRASKAGSAAAAPAPRRPARRRG
jgi:hypothetical protein